MKIAVYGAGGVGAYFGGRLARAGADVHLIARGEHLDALRREGLRVVSVDGDFAVDLPATDDPAAVGRTGARPGWGGLHLLDHRGAGRHRAHGWAGQFHLRRTGWHEQ